MISASKSRRNRSLAALAAFNRAGSLSSRSISTAAARAGSSRGQNRASTPSSQSSAIGPVLPATIGRPADIASMIASDDVGPVAGQEVPYVGPESVQVDLFFQSQGAGLPHEVFPAGSVTEDIQGEGSSGPLGVSQDVQHEPVVLDQVEVADG